MTKTKIAPRELTVNEIAHVSGGEAGAGSGFYSVRENEGGTGRLK